MPDYTYELTELQMPDPDDPSRLINLKVRDADSKAHIDDGDNPSVSPENPPGLYKFSVSPYHHVAATTPVVKSDITALGIPGEQPTFSVSSKTLIIS